MKNKIFLAVCLSLIIFLSSCSSSDDKMYKQALNVYDSWMELHTAKNLSTAKVFFENINNYDFNAFNFYPNISQEIKNDKVLMNQKSQELLELLDVYEKSPTLELELQICNVMNQIDILMIHYIQIRNFIIEEAQNRYTTFYIMLIVIIIIAITILIFFNERELRKKDKRISQSETMLKHTMEVQEAERTRISRELHDTVAQAMKYVSILAEKIQDKELSEKIITAQNDNIEDIRKMCYNLTPPNFKNVSIVETLNILADKIFEQNETQVRIVTNGDIDFSSYTDDQFINLYRIIQELFQNIKKHAQASEVTVLFRKEEHLKIIISDDGIGIDNKMISNINTRNFDLSQTLHFGIKNILERVQLLNATIEYRSVEDCGTTIIIVL